MPSSHMQQTPPRRPRQTPVHHSQFPIPAIATPPSHSSSPHLPQAWSTGTIPIFFDPSSPQGSYNIQSFPTVGSFHPISPPLGNTPTHSSPSSNEHSPSLTLRKKWRERSNRLWNNIGEDSQRSSGSGHRTTPRAKHPSPSRVGLNIFNVTPPEEPQYLSTLSPPSGGLIPLPSPSTSSSQDSNYLTPGDSESEVMTDNDDALSCFSLSAYFRSGSDNEDPENHEGVHRRFGGSARIKTPVLDSVIPQEIATAKVGSIVSQDLHGTLRKHTRTRSALRPPQPLHAQQHQASEPSTCAVSIPPSAHPPRPYSPHLDPLAPEPETPIVFSYPLPDDRPTTFVSNNHSQATPYRYPDPSPISSSGGGTPHYNLIPQVDNQVGPHSSGRTRSSSGASSARRHSRRGSLASNQLAAMPTNLTFLRETIVELWIDQEGFRAIRPQFQLQRLSSVGSSSTSVNDQTLRRLPHHDRSESLSRKIDKDDPVGITGEWGTAHFVMKKKQSWIFHYGTLDGPPVLRRLTVNGDDNKDFISRQASLTIKANGLYSLQGTEEKGKLQWKFEYLVEDRHAPISGIPLPGEKLLTPLSFTCSPLLLHQERGKKVKLFHVMRKSVAPKLSSSKIEPPTVPISPTKSAFTSSSNASSSAFSTHSSIADTSATSSISKAVDAFAKVVSRPTTPKRPSTPKRPTTPKRPAAAPRRPSTAREESRPPIVSSAEAATKRFRQRAASLSTNVRPSTATRTDWNKLFPHTAFQEPRGELSLASSQRSDIGGRPYMQTISHPVQTEQSVYWPGVQPSRNLPASPHTPTVAPSTASPQEKIVTAAQIQEWLAAAQQQPRRPSAQSYSDAQSYSSDAGGGPQALQPRTPQQKRPLTGSRQRPGNDGGGSSSSWV